MSGWVLEKGEEGSVKLPVSTVVGVDGLKINLNTIRMSERQHYVISASRVLLQF